MTNTVGERESVRIASRVDGVVTKRVEECLLRFCLILRCAPAVVVTLYSCV